MTRENEKKHLRDLHISHRKAISPKQQSHAAVNLAKSARGFKPLLNCRRVLSYSPVAGEIDPSILLSSLNSDVYLPRIMNYQKGLMQFFKANPSNTKQPTDLNANAFGIDEPSSKKPRLAAKHFDVVLMPLISFDREGNRLGMGAGFYDRSFSFRNQTQHLKRPLLVGLAHHSQETKSIISDPWDVSLDAIITDRELILL